MKPGDHVHIASLGKGIVRELRKGGRCLVEIKGRSMLVDEEQLSPVDVPKARARAVPPDAPAIPTQLSRLHAKASIDLHGMTTDEAEMVLDTFLSDAMLAGLAEVRVIHGRSGGRLKAAVHGRLKGLPSIRGYRVDASNPGVTVVTL